MPGPPPIQGSFFPSNPDEDGWRVFLRRDYPDYWERSLTEAHDRLKYHKKKRTHQTSRREEIPRSLAEEWFHLMGEQALGILLFRRGVQCDPMACWGDSSAFARERSREGNVMPGLSVYVPRIDGGGLIIRRDEAETTPHVRFVLVRLMRFGSEKEYLKAYGWRVADSGWKSGSNYGHQGTPLRDPGDRLVS